MDHILYQIHAASKICPNKVAIGLSDRSVTFSELIKAINTCQKKISSLNMDLNQVIGVAASNPIRYLTIVLALAKSGYGSMQFPFKKTDLPFNAGIKTVLSDRPFLDGRFRIIPFDDSWFALSNEIVPFSIFDVPPNKVAHVSFTSGSTGFPKPIALSFSMINERCLERLLTTKNLGNTLCSYEVSSTAGYVTALAMLMMHQSVYFDYSAEDAVKIIQNCNIERITGSVIRINEICNYMISAGIYAPNVRQVTTGGSFLDSATFSRIKRCFSGQIFNSYGSTEAGNSGIMDISMKDQSQLYPPRFVPLKKIRIENRTKAGSGAIYIYSKSRGLSFNGEPMLPLQKESENWFCPGDVGYVDEQGFLVVTGREDYLINIGGVKIAPEQIENSFLELMEISSCVVMQDNNVSPNGCIVVYVADKLIAKEDFESATISANLKLTIDQVYRVAEIPLTSSNKVDRKSVHKLVSEVKT